MSSNAQTSTTKESPSSRRAWIEISRNHSFQTLAYVALLAEGVDRNSKMHKRRSMLPCRPPRGGRG